ncbi:MAG: trypsin-like peptidase domain-containing protein [Roseiflexaceae bacterium]
MQRKLMLIPLLALALVLSACNAQGVNTGALLREPASAAQAAEEQVMAAAPTTQPLAAQVAPAASDGLAALKAQQQAFEDLFARVRPSVVQIVVSSRTSNARGQVPAPFRNLPGFQAPDTQQPNQPLQPSGEGSGFVYDTQGHIVTNNHVIDDAERIQVSFSDGTTAEAKLVGADPESDLAVIKIDTLPEGVQPLTIADAGLLRVGQITIAIGNPFGLSGSMTTGIISGLDRDLRTSTSQYRLPGIIQTDAAINPGNSGGPLLDLNGDVIGVNTAIESTSGSFAGVGFAVPADVVSRVVPTLISDGSYRYAWLGVSLLDVTPSNATDLGVQAQRGALVATVTDGGPAAKAGLEAGNTTRQINGAEVQIGGDLITAIDGAAVASAGDLISAILERKVGDTVTLTVERDGAEREIKVTLGERPTQQQ